MTIWWPKSALIQPRTSLGKSDVSHWGRPGASPMDAAESIGEASSGELARDATWAPSPTRAHVCRLLLLPQQGRSVSAYNHRGPLEYPFFRPFRGSFSAVSTPIFATKGAFFNVFRALHFFLCTIPDFSDFSGPLHQFCRNYRNFRWISI